MTLGHGVRAQVSALPARAALLPRGRVGMPRVPTRRIRPAGMVIAVILMSTLLGLVYLTQTLRAAATSLEIATLEAQNAELWRELMSQDTVIRGASARPAVLQWALRRGLDDLGRVSVVASER